LIRGALKSNFQPLLRTLWCLGGGFSSKRPFGKSGWKLDFKAPLIKAGVVAGKYDEESGGYEFKDYDSGRKAVDKIILRLIDSL